tara:strand:+ start:1348 stop:1641 length:294 start_codon:yes stop_codon:yes gene_type:complete
MSTKKCTCKNKQGGACPTKCSDFKLVFNLNATAKKTIGYNPARWSMVKENKLPPKAIIQNMLARLSKTDFLDIIQQTNVAQLYHRTNGLVDKHEFSK